MIRVTPARVKIETSVATSSGSPPVRAAALAGIFTVRIFTHDHPVEILGGDARERAHDAWQNAGGADIGILVEGLADREAQAPQRHVVGNVWSSDGAEVDRVNVANLREAIGGHHQPVALEIVRAPVVAVDVKAERAVTSGEHIENFELGGDHLLANAIARDGCDCVGFNDSMPFPRSPG